MTSNVPGDAEDDQELLFHIIKGFPGIAAERRCYQQVTPNLQRPVAPVPPHPRGVGPPSGMPLDLLFQFLAVWVGTDGLPRWSHLEEFESQESRTERVRHFMGDN